MKNIIFDIGSVLIGYRWRDMCLEEGWDGEKAEKIGGGFFDSPLWPDFDEKCLDRAIEIFRSRNRRFGGV